MSDIRKGFVTQIGMSYHDALDKARDFGFDYVEIMMDGANRSSVLQDEQKLVRERAEANQQDLMVHLPFKLDIGSPFENVRTGAMKELKHSIEVAAAAGAEKGVLHASSNAWSPAWDRDQIASNILRAIEKLTVHADKHDFQLAVENVPGEFFDIHDFERLFEKTDADMCLDTGHARISGMESEDMAWFIEQHHDRITHFHLNDTRRPSDEHLPFGAGTIDFEELFHPLQEAKWSGTMSLEVFTDDWDYINKSKDRLDALI